MHRRFSYFALFGLIALLTITACGQNAATKDWKTFAIEEEPQIDIQFRLPPEWLVDYTPTQGAPGQWDVALVPPKCSADQETEYDDNCVTLTIYLKGESDFDPNEFTSFTSQDITLNQSGSQKTIFLGEDSFDVDGLTIQRYKHLFFIGEEDDLMTFLYFETEGAYYAFITEMPYGEQEGEMAEQFSLLINSIEVID